MVVEWACLTREDERGKKWSAGKGRWPTLTHKSATRNPLSPQPRDRPVLLRNTGTVPVVADDRALGAAR